MPNTQRALKFSDGTDVDLETFAKIKPLADGLRLIRYKCDVVHGLAYDQNAALLLRATLFDISEIVREVTSGLKR
jgi:hypothetical protein